MNRTLIAALLAATALSSSIAWAQPNITHEGGKLGGGQPGQGNRSAPGQHQGQRQPQQPAQRNDHAPDRAQGGQGRPQAQPQAQAQRPSPQARQTPQARPQPQPQAAARTQGRFQARPQDQAQPQAQRQWQGGAAPRGGGAFSYGGRQHNQIQGGGFNYPSGYGYRRWGAGQLLPFLFLTSPFFFDSYADYGIGPPPYGYRWVRYGPDLLLVSRRTGRIRQVIYGVFY